MSPLDVILSKKREICNLNKKPLFNLHKIKNRDFFQKNNAN